MAPRIWELNIESKIWEHSVIEAVQVTKSRLQWVYQNVFGLKAVSNIKRLLGPKPIAITMKEELQAILTLLDG